MRAAGTTRCGSTGRGISARRSRVGPGVARGSRRAGWSVQSGRVAAACEGARPTGQLVQEILCARGTRVSHGHRLCFFGFAESRDNVFLCLGFRRGQGQGYARACHQGLRWTLRANVGGRTRDIGPRFLACVGGAGLCKEGFSGPALNKWALWLLSGAAVRAGLLGLNPRSPPWQHLAPPTDHRSLLGVSARS